MAFSVYSPPLWSGLVLFAGCVIAWRMAGPTRARHTLRFACLLFAAPAAALIALPKFSDLAFAAMLLATSLGAAALALALFPLLSRRVPAVGASLALVLALGLGLAAAITGAPVYALAPLVLAVGILLPLGLLRLGARRWGAALTLLGAGMLLCGGLALLDGGLYAAAFFFAAALPALARAAMTLQGSS